MIKLGDRIHVITVDGKCNLAFVTDPETHDDGCFAATVLARTGPAPEAARRINVHPGREGMTWHRENDCDA